MTPLEALRAERSKYPASHLSPLQLGTMLNDAMYRAGLPWGLLLKPSGNNCPCGVKQISCDIVFNRETGIHYDVLRDSEGAAEVTWNEVGPMDVSRWLAPMKPADAPDPPSPSEPPPDVPPPTDGALILVLKKLDELEKRITPIQDKLAAGFDVELNIPYLGTAKGKIR